MAYGNQKKTHADYCKILGVSEDASYEEISKIYKGLAKIYQDGLNGRSKAQHDKLQEINDAWDYFKRINTATNNARSEHDETVRRKEEAEQKQREEATRRRDMTINDQDGGDIKHSRRPSPRRNWGDNSRRTQSSGPHQPRSGGTQTKQPHEPQTVTSSTPVNPKVLLQYAVKAIKWVAVLSGLAYAAHFLIYEPKAEEKRLKGLEKERATVAQKAYVDQNQSKSKATITQSIQDKANGLSLAEFKKHAQQYEASEYKGIEENSLRYPFTGTMPFFYQSEELDSETQTVIHFSAMKAQLSPEQIQSLEKAGADTTKTIEAYKLRGAATYINYEFARSNECKNASWGLDPKERTKNIQNYYGKYYFVTAVENNVVFVGGKKFLINDQGKTVNLTKEAKAIDTTKAQPPAQPGKSAQADKSSSIKSQGLSTSDAAAPYTDQLPTRPGTPQHTAQPQFGTPDATPRMQATNSQKVHMNYTPGGS